MSWVNIRDVKFIKMSKLNMFITIVCVLFLTWPIFGYRWAAEDLKPWPCFGQKNPQLSSEFQLSSCYTSLNTQFKASKDVGNINTGML